MHSPIDKKPRFYQQNLQSFIHEKCCLSEIDKNAVSSI